jgi:cysteine rich repeat protein
MSYLVPLTTLVVLLFSSEIAYPQASRPQFRPGLDNRGTTDDQKACRGDARRHCRDVLSQGDMAVLGCLREHRSRISEGCRAVLTRYGQ